MDVVGVDSILDGRPCSVDALCREPGRLARQCLCKRQPRGCEGTVVVAYTCRLGLAVTGGHAEVVGAWGEELGRHLELEEGERGDLSECRKREVSYGMVIQLGAL